MGKRLSTCGTCVAALLLVVAGYADEQDTSAAETTNRVEAIHASRMDPGFSPRLGTYTYGFSWLLKTGAKSKITVERVGDAYRMTTTARTGWFVDRIYRVRYKGEATLDTTTLTPRKVVIDEAVRSTHKHTVLTYADGKIHSLRVKKKKRRDPTERTYEQDTRDGYVMDYFSAVLIARAMPWAVGDVRKVDVFEGKSISTATLECLGQRELKVLGKKSQTWHIRASVVQERDLDEDDKLIANKIDIYLAADESREILRIEADTPFGGMKVTLKKFEPATPEQIATSDK